MIFPPRKQLCRALPYWFISVREDCPGGARGVTGVNLFVPLWARPRARPRGATATSKNPPVKPGHCYFSPWNLPENNPWLKVSSQTRRDAKRMAFSPSSLSLLGGAQAAARSPPRSWRAARGSAWYLPPRSPRSAHGELHNAPTPSPDLHSPLVWSSCLGLWCSARSASGAWRSEHDRLETRYDLPPEHARA